MSIIKDLIDLSTQLANSVTDRKIAADLHSIQTMIFQIQSEQASLHETNIALREEKIILKDKIQELENQVKELKSSPIMNHPNGPTCPNCSTSSKPYFMGPMPKDFLQIMGVTHQCSKCNYSVKA